MVSSCSMPRRSLNFDTYKYLRLSIESTLILTMFGICLLFAFYGFMPLIEGHGVHHPTMNPSSNFLSYHDEELPDKFYVTHEAWFNISISENKFSPPIRSEKIVIGLFGEICPMTVTNFITITKGLRRSSVTNNHFHSFQL